MISYLAVPAPANKSVDRKGDRIKRNSWRVVTDGVPKEGEHGDAALLGAAPGVVLAVDGGPKLLLRDRADAAWLACLPAAAGVRHVVLGVRHDDRLAAPLLRVLHEHAKVVRHGTILPAALAQLLALKW